jgi:hypothetical protein
VHEQLDAELGDELVAELVHRLELPRGVDVEQRERQLGRVERLHGQCSITELSLPIEYSITGRSLSATRLAHDVDALRLEALQVRESCHIPRDLSPTRRPRISPMDAEGRHHHQARPMTSSP